MVDEQGPDAIPKTNESPRKPAGATGKRSSAGCLVLTLSGILFVLGGMAIDFKIVWTAIISAAVVVITFILGRLKVVPLKAVRIIQVAAIPTMIVFWIAWGYVEDWRVIPTTEYVEDHPNLKIIDHRTVILEEPSEFQLEPNGIRIAGATSLHDFYLSLARTMYGVADSGYVSNIRTPQAYQSLIDGWSDLIFVFRPSESQIADARAKGKEFTITPIGYDAFVFFVNQANPVGNLSVRQLKDIYSGKLGNWREAGGDDAKVIPFQRYENSGSQSRMQRFMEDETLMEPETEHRFKTMMPIITHVARYRNYRYAIGYSFLYYVKVMMEGGGVKVLNVDGVEPNLTTIRDGTYPLSEEICIVTAGSENLHVKPFIEWVLSPQGQAMLEEIGYVPINPVPSSPNRPKVRRAWRDTSLGYSATWMGE